MLSDQALPPPAPKRRITLAAREQFRTELVNIARRIFLSEGYAAVTIRRITTEAGVTPMAFYWYFDCKDALLIVIWDEIIGEVAQACQRHSENAPEATRLLTYFDAMLDFWLTHPDYFRFIFLGESPNVDMVRLRQQLQNLPGTQRVHKDLHALLRLSAPAVPDVDAACTRIRTLLIYRLFGFLHSVISMRQPDGAQLTQMRDWVETDLKNTLTRWRQGVEF